MANFVLNVEGHFNKAQLEADLSKLTPTVNVKTNLSGGGYKEVQKFSDSIGNTVTRVREFDSANKQVSSSITKVNTDLSKGKSVLGNMANTFVDTTKKVMQFGASTAVIGVFYQAIREAKDAVFEFDYAMTEFKKVTELSESQLDSYTKKLGELGTEVGRTRKPLSARVYSNMH